MMTRTESMLIWHTEAMTQENDELRRQNKVLLDRLHQCKRRNREDKARLRNELDRAKESRDFYHGELYYQGLLDGITNI